MRILKAVLACTLTTAIALPAGAAGTPGRDRAPLLVAVTRCRAITDSAARLACFDQSVAALDTAETRRSIVVVDQQQVRETRRTLFGMALPDTGVFGQGVLGKSEDLPQIETTLASALVDESGRWSFRLADGARWIQTDDTVIARRPRAPDTILIKRAALGSFRLSVAGQPGVKAKRVN